MRTVNKVLIIGNITRDPMIKTTDNGKKVALFTIATNRTFKTADGENKSESEFHNCVSWGTLAETCEKYLSKGKLVYCEGRLKTKVLDREDGTRSYKTEIIASSIIFLNKRSDFEGSSYSNDEVDNIEAELNSQEEEEDNKF